MKFKVKLLKACSIDGKAVAAGSIVMVDEDTLATLLEQKIGEQIIDPPPVSESRVTEMLAAKFAEAEAKIAEFEAREAIRETELTTLKAQVKERKPLVIVGKDNTQDDPANKFFSIGDQLQAVKAAFIGQGVDKRLKVMDEEGKLVARKAASGFNEAVPSEGGYLIQPEYSTELFRVMHETGLLASKVQRREIGGNNNGLSWMALDESSRVDGSRFGGLRVYRAHEAGLKTASMAKFTRREIRLEKMIGLFYSTDELIEDSTALTGEVSEWFGEEFSFKVDSEIVRGTGAGEMLGILNSTALVSVAKETGQTAGTIVAENVVNMYSRMLPSSLARAVWYINIDTLPKLMLMKIDVGTGGQPAYLPANGLASAPFGTLLGRPLFPIEQASTVGTVGDIIFADLGYYKMISKGGVDAASSIHVRFLYDETAFRFTVRNNGQPMMNAPITPNQGSNTLSPFVALATRA